MDEFDGDDPIESIEDAERELEESETRLRLLADAAFEAIVILDQGTILAVNQAFADLFGVEAAEVVGTSALDLAAPETRALVMEKMREGSEEPYRAMGMRSDGSTFPMELRGRSIPLHGRTVRATAIRDLTERFQAEKALREVEGRLTSLIESLPVAVLLVDKSGKPRFANRVAEELLGRGIRGLGPEARAGQLPDVYHMYVSGTDRLYPYDRTPIVRALTGQHVTVEDVEIRRPDRTIPIEVTAAPVMDESGEINYAVMVFKDITLRRRAEAALREAEKKYRDIFENSVVGMFQSTREGRFITVNQVMATTWGYETPEQMIADIENIAERYVEPGRRQDFIRRLESDGAVQWFEAEVHRKDGTTFWMRVNARAVMDVTGRTLYYEGTVEDVTPRHEAQEMLRDSEERYRAVVETSPDAIAVVDLNYTFQTVNRQAAAMYGVDDPGELEGMSVLDIVAPYDRVRVFENSIRGLETGEVHHNEYDLVRADGSVLPAEVSSSRMVDAAGVPVGLIAIVRDITERRRGEQALQCVNAELEGFAHTVSHDLKGPISGIALAADTLEVLLENRTDEAMDEVGQVSRMIGEAAGRATALIDDLLSLAEAGNVPREVEEVDVSVVVGRVLEERAGDIRERGLEVKADDDLGRLMASPTHVYQLFGNLVGNVLAHNTAESPSMEISRTAGPEGGGYTYLVRDNGPGIPAGLLDKVFMPFARGEDGSTGIGLTIVERIVSLYGGTIRVYNDGGACFEFSLRGLNGPGRED
ncbi:MAG: PAS domain S-box protein [Actinobacteria bacterium]|nr:PAS domain S-box protein [Actinomycetota bacterium]MBU1942784.1 PAS domain S-box protein [Actinomycetota bacterium]MBU2686106.1 PAS domain S-box protein [Actinomycetota bacterium]